MIDAAEAQRIERSDGARAHREDIAQDTADPGGGALIRLNERRMVVTFHLERHGEPAADVDDTGIFPGPLKYVATFSGKVFEKIARAFIATMLGPHYRENAQLGIVRFAPESLYDLLVFVRRESVAGNELRRYLRLGEISWLNFSHATLPGWRGPPQSKQRF